VPASDVLLEARGLECTRGERRLFAALSLALHAGELLRIGGVNGSGKTSLLRMLCGLLPPTEGEVLWRGERISELRDEYSRELLYIGHTSALKDDLTAVENLRVAAALAGRPVDAAGASQALARLGLAASTRLPTRVLSQGQRRRVALARLLLRRELGERTSLMTAGAIHRPRAAPPGGWSVWPCRRARGAPRATHRAGPPQRRRAR
jgi:heme exporter protein A